MLRISYEEVEALVEREFRRMQPEKVNISRAIGRILAEDITSDKDFPLYDTSEKDGYALNHRSILNASSSSPILLKVDQIIRPGFIPSPLKKDSCSKILTGAWLPQGADSVVMQEEAVEKSDGVLFKHPVSPWSNVVRKGDDIKKGEKIIPKWKKVGAYELVILYTLGIQKVSVLPNLRVAILSTGSELISNYKLGSRAKIIDINRPVLTRILQGAGYDTVDAGIASDDIKEISKKTQIFMKKADAMVITGGSSVGKYDMTTDSLKKIGANILFHGVKLRPSSTAGVAELDGKPIFLLSGLIQSAVLATFLIVLPTLHYIQGAEFGFTDVITAKLNRDLVVDAARDFLRAVWVKISSLQGELVAEPLIASSHVRSVLVKGNGLLLVRGGTALRRGQTVKVNIIKSLP